MDLSRQEMHKDRFGFTMFLSITLHVIVLIGIGLEFPTKKANESITISLVQRTPNHQVLSRDIAQEQPTENFMARMENSPLTKDEQPSLELMIEDLQIKIENRRRKNRQRPQRQTISTVSAQEEQAIYLKNWRNRIEEVGNLNYPDQARKDKVFGSLRILVAVRVDGQVEDIRILETSGSKVLDDAAVRIALLAAPFDPLPEGISHETDILEIIRTWRFHEGKSPATF